MMKRVSFVAAFMVVGLTAVVLGTVAQNAVRAQGSRDEGLAARVQALEAREAIRTLYAEYGRTLDARDFNAFSLLFSRDAEVGSAKGPAAIGAFLEKAIGTNYPDSKGKNYHLYFNESIDIQGDRGTGISKGGFVMATPDNSKADFLLLATYRDEYVKEDGRWKFRKRQTVGDIPVPRPR
jgi:SnoaL-like protein